MSKLTVLLIMCFSALLSFASDVEALTFGPGIEFLAIGGECGVKVKEARKFVTGKDKELGAVSKQNIDAYLKLAKVFLTVRDCKDTRSGYCGISGLGELEKVADGIFKECYLNRRRGLDKDELNRLVFAINKQIDDYQIKSKLFDEVSPGCKKFLDLNAKDLPTCDSIITKIPEIGMMTSEHQIKECGFEFYLKNDALKHKLKTRADEICVCANDINLLRAFYNQKNCVAPSSAATTGDEASSTSAQPTASSPAERPPVAQEPAQAYVPQVPAPAPVPAPVQAQEEAAPAPVATSQTSSSELSISFGGGVRLSSETLAQNAQRQAAESAKRRRTSKRREELQANIEKLQKELEKVPATKRDGEVKELREKLSKQSRAIKRLKDDQAACLLDKIGGGFLPYGCEHFEEKIKQAEQRQVSYIKSLESSEQFQKIYQGLASDELKRRLKAAKESMDKLSHGPKLGNAKPCRGNRAKKYQCYKKNMKVFHENVFGYWKNKLDKQKEKHAKVLELEKNFLKDGKFDKKFALEKLEKMCAEKADAKKSFNRQFCKNGKVKAWYKKGNNFKNGFARFKRLSKKSLKKAEAKFKVELKAYKNNAKFFAMNFMQELLAENDTLKDCIDATHFRPKSYPANQGCFYSSMDIVECLAEYEFSKGSGGAPLVQFDSQDNVEASLILTSGSHSGESSYRKCSSDITISTAADAPREAIKTSVEDISKDKTKAISGDAVEAK